METAPALLRGGNWGRHSNAPSQGGDRDRRQYQCARLLPVPNALEGRPAGFTLGAFFGSGPGFLRFTGAASCQLGLGGLEQLRATARLLSGTLVPTCPSLPE